MQFTPDTGHRRSKRPRFGYEATVEVYTRTGPDSRPAAVLKASDWSWDRDGAHRDATYRAKCQLAELQVPLEVIQNAYFETAIDAWWALDPKHVRNPEGKPVEARYLTLDQAERATLIRQQRLVPDDLADSTALYLKTVDKPVVPSGTVTTQAVPA